MAINDEHPGGYRPKPLDPTDVPDWYKATATGETPNEQVHSLLQSALVQHGKYLEHIAPLQSQMTPEGYSKQLKAFGTTEAAKAVDTAEQLSTRRREQAEQEFSDTLRSLSSQGDAAAEARAQRTVARAERQLASIDPAKRSETERQLIADADRESLGVILQELPSFGVSPDIIEAAAVQAVPELGAAARRVAKARQSESIVRNDAKRVRDGIATGRRPSVPLVGALPKYDPDQ
jgi:hypothetical protein